jgi:hypothetical protein
MVLSCQYYCSTFFFSNIGPLRHFDFIDVFGGNQIRRRCRQQRRAASRLCLAVVQDPGDEEVHVGRRQTNKAIIFSSSPSI